MSRKGDLPPPDHKDNIDGNALKPRIRNFEKKFLYKYIFLIPLSINMSMVCTKIRMVSLPKLNGKNRSRRHSVPSLFETAFSVS